MRKAIFAFLMLFSSMFLALHSHASNLNASAIFSNLGSGVTATLDRGGVVHSQARSIYSMGGGMISARGKRVSLLAADPPSFSAGCAGVSWHFGGFSFISMDEIRQLVEAVAQASLGVAIDLAMQVLCPQCYAVMSKLRDIANMMRNAAADACKIAQNLGRMVTNALNIEVPEKRQTECSAKTAEGGLSTGFLNSAAGALCRGLQASEGFLKTAGDTMMKYLEGDPTAKTPDKNALAEAGNITYRTLRALGYADGFAKDLMMSLMGMTMVFPGSTKDCTQLLANIKTTPEAAASANDMALEETARRVTASEGAVANPADATTNRPNAKDATSTDGGTAYCNMAPLMSSIKSTSRLLLCGPQPQHNIELFARKFEDGNVEKVKASSLGIVCGVAGDPNSALNLSDTNNQMYTCREGAKGVGYMPGRNVHAQCLKPGIVSASELLKSTGANEYTGVLWHIADGLYEGVKVITANNGSPLPAATLRILNGSDYPLYRVLNMAAVYPGLASEILSGYSALIGAQHVMDALERIVAVGAQPGLEANSQQGVNAAHVRNMRVDIQNMMTLNQGLKEQIMERLAQKRSLVELILQINKALQTEVMAKGLNANADMAVSLRRQVKDLDAGPPAP